MFGSTVPLAGHTREITLTSRDTPLARETARPVRRGRFPFPVRRDSTLPKLCQKPGLRRPSCVGSNSVPRACPGRKSSVPRRSSGNFAHLPSPIPRRKEWCPWHRRSPCAGLTTQWLAAQMFATASGGSGKRPCSCDGHGCPRSTTRDGRLGQLLHTTVACKDFYLLRNTCNRIHSPQYIHSRMEYRQQEE